MFKYLLIIITCIFCFSTSYAQRGKQGDVVVSVQEEWLNTYTFLSNDANVGDDAITVDDNSLVGGIFSNSLEPGDLVLLIQMHGADVDVETYGVEVWGGTYTTQTSWQNFGQGGTNPDWDQTEFGQVLNYNNSGNYEQLEVADVSGNNQILFTCPLSLSYTAAHNVQVVRIPRISNLTLLSNSSITCPQWDGQTGGIIALEVDKNIVMEGSSEISARSKGFRGGITNNVSAVSGASEFGQGFLGSYEQREGSEKGESIFGFYAEYEDVYSRYCRGAFANGGGGANFHNAGGGGGANVGIGVFTGYGVPNPGTNNEYIPAWNLEDPSLILNPSSGGGRGGYSHIDQNNNALTVAPANSSWGGDKRRIAGGVGGHTLTYNQTKVFMGGGGGAGDMNDNQGGSGGRGGGIVCLSVYGEILGEGSISANGENGENAEGGNPSFTGKTGDDGAGGAGGGGSVIISNSLPISDQVEIHATGGRGGNQVLRLGAIATAQADGPGGGGGGGLIRLSVPHTQIFIEGGAGGTTNSAFMTEFPHNGATGGAEGLFVSDAPFYDLIVVDDTICGGGDADLVVSVEGVLPSGAEIHWFENAFDENSFHTGTSFTTPLLSENTTYYVGVCPGTFRKAINVLVSPEIVISGDAVIIDETCTGMDGEIGGLDVTGGYGDLTYSWNGEETPTIDLSGVNGGDYELVVTDENGCQASAGPFTVGASPGPEIDASNVVITAESCDGNDGAILGITVQGDDLTFSWNGQVTPSAELVGVSSGNYTLEVTDTDGCTTTAGPFVVESEGGPVIDDSNHSIQQESCAGNDGSISGITAEGDGLIFEWNGEIEDGVNLTGISAGKYTLVVTDENGCSATAGPFIVAQEEGPTIDDANITITPAACGEENGAISGIVVEGDGLTFSWNGNTSPTVNISDLAAGSYSLTVTDENNCESSSGPYLVSNLDGPEIDTSMMVIEHASCGAEDGQISGIVVIGDNLTIEWNGVVSSTTDITNLAPGNYSMVVTDDQGCVATLGPIEVEGTEGPSINDVNLTITPESCLGFDGAITGLEVSGNNVSYFWNEEAYDSADLSGVSSGMYTLEVIDSTGCTATYGPIEVDGISPYEVWVDPEFTVIDAGENVQLQVEVEEPGEITAISWSPTTRLSCSDCPNPIANPVNTTTYTVTVQTSDGCERTLTVIIEVNAICGDLYLPSHFSPNNDGNNDYLCVLGGCIETFDFQVYNRWGELVYFSNDPDECWDGTYKGEPLNSAVFAYQLIATLTDGTEIQKSGNVTIVR